MKFFGRHNEYLEITEVTSVNSDLIKTCGKSELSLLWFTSTDNHFVVDAVHYKFHTNDIISLTEFHKIDIKHLNSARLIRWNRPFYCVVDHDSEVSCKGILYYGASNLPVIHPSQNDLKTLSTVWEMLLIEMKSKDNLQLEMLQMMLKRLLILCTRIYKTQENYNTRSQNNIDIIRDYNFLVEQYFREKHSVAEYAKLLHKSPKTLSNLFKKVGSKTPLQFIQERIMLEARRMLNYTDKNVSEIGYELGFSDIQAFSRFFKKQQGIAPSDFKEKSV